MPDKLKVGFGRQKATVHWIDIERLAIIYPKAQVVSDARLVDEVIL